MAGELLKTIEFLKAYIEALDTGVNKFVDTVPLLVKQQINTLAKRRLNSSYENYMSAVKVRLDDYVLLVELDQDNWLANAVEQGVAAFDMKEKMLNGPKARINKKGQRFNIIPISKEKDGKGNNTDKSQDIQKRINEVLKKPKLGPSQLKVGNNGQLRQSQKILSDDPKLSGFYRTRTFESTAQYYEGKSKPKWGYVMFRIVSENSPPESWQHPGLEAVGIFKTTQNWLDTNLESLLEGFLEAELKDLLKG